MSEPMTRLVSSWGWAGAGRFSRILSLNTWLQSACRIHNIGFIDNFNLFWSRLSLFRTDGMLSRLLLRMTDN